MLLLGIDPGHGGPRDLGATSGGLVEKDLNRALCEELLHALPWKLVHGILLRVNDEAVTHTERGLRAVECDWVISVHHNSSGNPKQHGAEAYLMPGCSERERLVADTILWAMPSELRPRVVSSRIFIAHDGPGQSDDWLQRPAAVLDPFAGNNRILVEVGYQSNEKDAAFISSDAGRMAAVSAIRAGIAAAVLADGGRDAES